jgi:hypothetical protein
VNGGMICLPALRSDCSTAFRRGSAVIARDEQPRGW